jgi:hypothetical protein
MAFNSISGSRIIGKGTPQAVPIQLDPAPYTGAIAYGSDGLIYVSNGTAWNAVGAGIQGTTGLQGDDGLQGTQGTYGPGFDVIGSVTDVDTGGDQQATLNTAFPSATTGQGVIDNADDELWVYDGAVWVNVGSFRGVQGFQGTLGNQGTQGTIGEEGIQGSRGYRGFQGTQGIQGDTGIQGMQGIQGDQGVQGIQGVQGDQGTQGIQGLLGFQGIQGPQSIQGTTGIQGDLGFQGFSGDDSGMVVQYNVGHQFAEPGPATSGFMIFNSPAADTGALTGATKLWIADSDTFNIDLTAYFNALGTSSSTNKGYIKITLRDNPSTYAIFSIQGLVDDGSYFDLDVTYLSGNGNKEDFVAEDLPSNPGTYISLPCIVALDISGDRGFQGVQGFQGTQGHQGVQGLLGNQGTQGPQSIQGIQGHQGIQGIKGIQGNQGTQGIQGIQGVQSVQGVQGIQGGTGTQGIQGLQGDQGVQGIQGFQGYQGTTGIQGDTGFQGTLGNQGIQGIGGNHGGLTFEWNFNSNVTPTTDPGTSNWKINNADITLATKLTIDDLPLDNYSAAIDDIFDYLDSNQSAVKGQIFIESEHDDNGPPGHHFVVYEFTNWTWDSSGSKLWGEFDVTHVESSSVASNDWNNVVNDHGSKAIINFIPAGIRGTQGVQGHQGVQGVQGVQGTQGPQSIQGTTGIQGMQGMQGIEGARTFTVTSSGSTDYIVDTVADPVLHLIRGFTYLFDVDAPGHPFDIRVSNGGAQYNDGVTNNGAASGIITFRVPFDAPASLYYQCQLHAGMGNTIVTSDLGPQGTQGVQALQGIQGFIGLQGDTGAGNQGIQGTIGIQGDTGFQGVQGFPGPIGPQGTQGTFGLQGGPGQQGTTGSFGGVTFDYTFSTDTTTSDPGVGTLKFSNTSINSAGNLYMDDRDDNFTDIQPFLRTIDDSTSPIKGHFKVSENGSPENFAVFTITSVQELSGYFNIISSYVNGSVTSFTDGEDVVITFARTGDIGATGSQGTTGIQGDVGSQGTAGFIGGVGSQGVQGFQGTQGFQGFQGNEGIGTQGATGIQGPEGQQGDEGEVGGDGPQGVQGSLGFQGADGFQGMQGMQGTQGVGAPGASGIQGNDGFQGIQGMQAAQGIQGNVGPIGFGTQGVQGLQGFQGESGFQGAGGFQGISGSGNQGVQGFNGFQGFQGDNGFQGPSGAGNQGVQGFQGAIGIGDVGFQGTQGLLGPQGISGEEGTGGVQGLQGYFGFQGMQGISGALGNTGLQGFQGISGTGIQGVQGRTGQGVQGMQGFQGLQGFLGFQGAIGGGVQGFQGTAGFQGDYGFQGTQGVQGPGNEGGVGNLQNVHTSGLQETPLFIPMFEAGADQRQLLATTGPNPNGESNFFYTSNIDELSVENINLGGNIDIGGSLTAGALTGLTSDLNLPNNVYMGFGTNQAAKLGFDSTGSGTLNIDVDTTNVNAVLIEKRSDGSALFTFDTATGSFTASGDVVTNSDERLKTNIKTISEALPKVMELRGVSFNMKDNLDLNKIGLIAQEVEKVIPEVVLTDKSSQQIKSVAYSSLVGLLVEAIKDLKTEVDEIKVQ